MVPLTNEATSNKQAHFMNKIGPTVTNIGVSQQVNDRIALDFGSGDHFMASTKQLTSKSGLSKYHHQSLCSQETRSMLKELKQSSKVNINARHEHGPDH
jgi:hypothetical protein